MSEPEERLVCDITLLMRTRLLFGMYNKRTLRCWPPRWRRLAQAYCLILVFAVSVMMYFAHGFWTYEPILLYLIPSFIQYYLVNFVSLWTADEYIYKIFTLNKLTDVTLDSPKIFCTLQKQMRQAYCSIIVFYFVYFGFHICFFNGGAIFLFSYFIPSVMFDTLLAFFSLTKILIFALFNARLLVLKRRLQRYGFRTIGNAKPQPYCQIYDEIWDGLDAMDSFKLLLFIDLICNCCKFISTVGHFAFEIIFQEIHPIMLLRNTILGVMVIIERMVISFGHIAFLESANVHCNEMAVFTATQLIKNPTPDERKRIREFLGLLERRGARYRIFRELPLDARFVLRVLGFCTAQIILFVSVIKESQQ